ncbi:hypothetical protein Q8A67_025116 [Cirrhinus molitorella]|uniref:Uncharacterized protein n=1 Tax=Cirrhinus molitorella TaxID=172907 RepID=A0AA88TB75_9TELE|nr:hypothetical protein Q8A67_025116 [Cirrhinus molitorella]
MGVFLHRHVWKWVHTHCRIPITCDSASFRFACQVSSGCELERVPQHSAFVSLITTRQEHKNSQSPRSTQQTGKNWTLFNEDIMWN